MTLHTGDLLQERYRIVSSLGQGGMGAVYRAWHLNLHIPVAIKEMIPQPNLEAQTLTQLRRQFQQEAAILAHLHHPHLVGVSISYTCKQALGCALHLPHNRQAQALEEGQ